VYDYIINIYIIILAFQHNGDASLEDFSILIVVHMQTDNKRKEAEHRQQKRGYMKLKDMMHKG
jgi:hypothetical protein